MMAEWLAAEGFEPVGRSSPAAAVEEVRARAFDLLIADAAFALRDGLLAGSRARRPQTPAVVIGDSGAARCNASSSRVVHLGRPVERAILVCTASMIILDGRPIRQSPRKPIDRLTAIVNGVPVYIIDVSNEGLRLDVPAGRRLVPPPYFEVQVPLVGAAIAVRRMWTGSWPGQGRPEAMRYGVALTQNRVATEQAWRRFVDATPIAVAGEPSATRLQVDNWR
jgi:hypothetical protein